MRCWLLPIALFMLAGAASADIQPRPLFTAEQIAPTGLTAEQAEQVVILVLESQKMPYWRQGWFIDSMDNGDPFVPGFISYSPGFWAPKAAAATMAGMYTVDPMTGDVWEFNLCRRFSFPRLARIQGMIMKRTGKTLATNEALYARLGCEPLGHPAPSNRRPSSGSGNTK